MGAKTVELLLEIAYRSINRVREGAGPTRLHTIIDYHAQDRTVESLHTYGQFAEYLTGLDIPALQGIHDSVIAKCNIKDGMTYPFAFGGIGIIEQNGILDTSVSFSDIWNPGLSFHPSGITRLWNADYIPLGTGNHVKGFGGPARTLFTIDMLRMRDYIAGLPDKSRPDIICGVTNPRFAAFLMKNGFHCESVPASDVSHLLEHPDASRDRMIALAKSPRFRNSRWNIWIATGEVLDDDMGRRLEHSFNASMARFPDNTAEEVERLFRTQAVLCAGIRLLW